MTDPKMNPCKTCGKGRPKLHTSQVAEDTMAIWAVCDACGDSADAIEDAYIFPGMAEDAAAEWNKLHPATV